MYLAGLAAGHSAAAAAAANGRKSDGLDGDEDEGRSRSPSRALRKERHDGGEREAADRRAPIGSDATPRQRQPPPAPVSRFLRDAEATLTPSSSDGSLVFEEAVTARASPIVTPSLSPSSSPPSRELSTGGGSDEDRGGVEETTPASVSDLVAVYDAMERSFAARAFDATAVAEVKRWFHFEEPPGVGVWPIPYTKMDLPRDCTRLVVFMLEDAPAVAAAAARASREVGSTPCVAR